LVGDHVPFPDLCPTLGSAYDIKKIGAAQLHTPFSLSSPVPITISAQDLHSELLATIDWTSARERILPDVAIPEIFDVGQVTIKFLMDARTILVALQSASGDSQTFVIPKVTRELESKVFGDL
jgi:hypothetical protein